MTLPETPLGDAGFREIVERRATNLRCAGNAAGDPLFAGKVKVTCDAAANGLADVVDIVRELENRISALERAREIDRWPL